MRVVLVAFAAIVTAGATGACGLRTPAPAATVPPAPAVIGELKDFQETLGVSETKNFLRSSDRASINRCYFASKLELPASYAGLRLTSDDERKCAERAKDFDVFFYPVEAVASGKVPVTRSLVEAPVERMLVVVPHEDFHNQPEARNTRPELAEAAATLTGFVTASEFARTKYGIHSTIFRNLDREAILFLQKAAVVNDFSAVLDDLYASYKARRMSKETILAKKADVFDRLRRACEAIDAPVSFNRCPAVLNNAGLAFERTYTREYPSVYRVYRDARQDPKATIEALKHIVAGPPPRAPRALAGTGQGK